MSYLDKYKVAIPEGTSGGWTVEKFTVKADSPGLTNYNMKNPGRAVPPGLYTQLLRKGHWGPIMTDTPAEIRDLLPLRRKARGQVLINGLGLGVAVKVCLDNPEVDHVTVVEISQDVIQLVGDYLQLIYEDRLTIIHADVFEYKFPKGVRFDVVWHDIWDDICTDNLPEIHRLHRKYGRRTNWQGSWCRYECERARAQGY